MSADGPGRGGPTGVGDPPASDTQPAAQDAADLGNSAPGEGNQPGAAADEAESRVQQAVNAANAVAEETGGMGEPGRPMNRRSPFYIGLTGAAGVAVTYGLVELFARSRSILIIIGLGLFIAVGLDPVVSWLTRRGLPRWAAVLVVIAGLVGMIGIFLAIAIPPLTSQTTALAKHVPTYLHQLQNHNSELGKLNQKYQIQQKLTNLLTSKGSSLIGGVLGAGALVISTFSSALAVLVLTIYFLAGLPSIKLFAYHLVPHSRRPRVILITDQIFVKVGGYVLGNVLTSAIAGLGTFFWMLAFHIPYPVLLGLLVAILDLIPVVGSTIGGLDRDPRGPDGLAAHGHRHPRLLRHLPSGRGLPDRAAHHGPHRGSARRRQPRGGPDRGSTARDRRRADCYPGGGRDPAYPDGSPVPADGQELARSCPDNLAARAPVRGQHDGLHQDVRPGGRRAGVGGRRAGRVWAAPLDRPKDRPVVNVVARGPLRAPGPGQQALQLVERGPDRGDPPRVAHEVVA